MKRCPITYEEIDTKSNYSERGLKLLSPQLKQLSPLLLSTQELHTEAIARVGKMSIQGVQPKLSAKLKVNEGRFDIVDQYGQYILKPSSLIYPELPENEAITMTLAGTIGLDVPVHGLIHGADDQMTYFVKRFDRTGHHKKLALEDFAQLSGEDRYTKYDSSMEKVADIIEKFCTFPKIELLKLFTLTLFNYLTGNEDMHLKNFSLITKDNKVMLSPAYDLLNSTIAQKNTKEELALPLHGKKSQLTKRDLIQYFARERLALNDATVMTVLQTIQVAIPIWHELIKKSFLSKPMQQRYINLLDQRYARLIN